jgi:7-carboxy-7-deazaguanine synthase
METIRISEIFGPTIQGEGVLIGQPTVFVRTGGCDYRCSWCDTMHAVDSRFRDDWRPMTAAEIFLEVQRLSGGRPIMVSLSGGNPAIQPLGELIALGKSHGYQFALETQGSVAQDWFGDLDVLTLSPKPPSSGMQTDFTKLDECIAVARDTKTVLKFVVFDDADYDYAKTVAAKYLHSPVYLQPGNHAVNGEADTDGIMARMRWLVEKTIADGWFAATVLPQLHVLIWGNKRGV